MKAFSLQVQHALPTICIILDLQGVVTEVFCVVLEYLLRQNSKRQNGDLISIISGSIASFLWMQGTVLDFEAFKDTRHTKVKHPSEIAV